MAEAGEAGFIENCRRIAERHDRERYLTALFAQSSAQPALFVLLAANHEIAKTAEVVSEPMIGAIRLQWWRDSLDGIEAGTPRTHEVITPLFDIVTATPALLSDLRGVIDARDADLEGEAPEDLNALIEYADGTGGNLHRALARVLGGAPELGGRIGRLWAVVGMMRGLPHLIRVGRRPFPKALLEQNNLSHQKISDKGPSPELRSAIAPVLAWCRTEHQALAQEPALKAGAVRPHRLLVARTADILKKFEKTGGDPFAAQVAEIPIGLVWRHTRRAILYRFGV
jgi:phytoene synthase